MAAREGMLSKYLTFILIFNLTIPFYHAYFIEEIGPADCKTGDDDEYHEYFDISQLRCLRCSQASTLQTVSSDGLRCQCQPGYRLTKDFGGGEITCAACPANQPYVSVSGWECISCDTARNPGTTCPFCNTRNRLITVERSLDGSWGFQGETRQCYTCDDYTSPNDQGNRCERCSQVLSVLPGQTDCDCPTNQQAGGVCFSDSADLPDDNAELYRVNFGGDQFGSAFFYQNIRAAKGMCEPKYGNSTACQMLGNMCVMIQYNVGVNDACNLYKELAGEGDKPPNMPWLYYEDRGDVVLGDDELTATFTFPDTKLDFVVAKYAANGSYLGMSDVTDGELQLCKNSESILNAAYDFGTTYTQSCELNVASFFDESQYETIFYDMFLKFQRDGFDALYPIPVYVGSDPDEDKSTWELVRRFFLVDNVSGKEYTSSSAENDAGETTTTRSFAEQAKAVRYASSIKIHIELKEGETDGSIIPPYMTIQYQTASSSDRDNNKMALITFDVSYSMLLEKYKNDMAIAVGVLSAFAIVYSAVQTWGWSKRAGKIGIDFQTLLKFVLFTIASLANVFFLVAFGSAIWWFIFYKNQSAVYLIVPEESREFVIYLATSFSLKLLALIHMIFVQVRVDIFFVDWERPKAKSSGDGGEVPVSIWRTYFAANEWNEIQTMRKINQIFLIFCVMLFLYNLGFENMAVMSPSTALTYDDHTYKPPMSKIFRFAVGGLCYLLIALVQWIFFTFIYERFIEDKVRQYTDLCSMANISVFILENDQFGYYIHGRSPHGRADTNLLQMHEDFKREEENMCGKRGLTPNTEQQTFEMSIPRRLREQYNRVMMPILQRQQGAQAQALRGQGGNQGSHLDAHTERCIQAYGIINRFLQSFIDHSLRDIDYTIEDKLLLESILRVEFKDGIEKGFLYNDSGHSFDQILFFGNETLLTIFDLLVFSIVDYIAENFVLAAICTYAVGQIIVMIRDGLGRKNLAAKTLVDERFLI